VFGDKALKRNQIYEIIGKVEEGGTGSAPKLSQQEKMSQKLGIHHQYCH
jgi:hypothetical protein